MSETVYLNGQFLPFEQAHVSVRDRGFLFADGVYEVVRYYNGRPVAMAAHLERLKFSLGRIKLARPADSMPFDQISDELIARNGLPDSSVYWQVTRGTAARTHAFPSPPVPPTVVAMVQAEPALSDHDEPKALEAITHDDLRWTQCAIKSVSLLANVLARQAAVEAGRDEAVLLRGCTVTEGTARSIFIAERGKLVTHPLDGSILGSITREIAIDLAHQFGLPVVEEQFEVDRLLGADEVITVGTTTEIAAIVRVDERVIADGRPGPMVRQLCAGYRQMVRRECAIG